MKKVLWVKFGWSEYYRGGPVDGNFEWLTVDKGDGHEAFNFQPGPDGRYYCYVPPHGPSHANPWSIDPNGWTIYCLAKFPPRKGVHLIGWYENATLLPKPRARPEYKEKMGFPLDNKGNKFTYVITSDTAFFVPPELRTAPFSHESIKQAKYSYLDGPDSDIRKTPQKREILRILERERSRLLPLVVTQPDPENAPDESENETDPLGGFGTPKHRKAVEEAAELAAKAELERMGYEVIRRASENLGYDFQAKPRSGGSDLYVEVKGTSGSKRRFFMTPNERQFMKQRGWRLAMVTNALTNPETIILKRAEAERRFSIQLMVWIGKEIDGLD